MLRRVKDACLSILRETKAVNFSTLWVAIMSVALLKLQQDLARHLDRHASQGSESECFSSPKKGKLGFDVRVIRYVIYCRFTVTHILPATTFDRPISAESKPTGLFLFSFSFFLYVKQIYVHKLSPVWKNIYFLATLKETRWHCCISLTACLLMINYDSAIAYQDQLIRFLNKHFLNEFNWQRTNNLYNLYN